MKTFVQIVGVALVAAVPVFGEVPSLLNYQGKLTDSGGDPVTGTVEVTVAIYTNPAVGEVVYSEDVGTVPVEDGIYSFEWGESGTSTWTVIEQLGIGDGSTSIFNYTVESPPIVNPSVTISDGTFSWNDVTGSSSPGNFLGTVSSYSNGQVSAVYLSGAPPAATLVTVEYMYRTTGITTPLERSNEAWFEVSLDQSPLSPRTRLAAVPFSLISGSSVNQMLPIAEWAASGSQIPTTGTKDLIYFSYHGGTGAVELEGVVMPNGGSVRAVVMQTHRPVSAGTCTAKVLIDGMDSGASAILSVVNPTAARSIFSVGQSRFEPGALIGIRLECDGFATNPDNRRITVRVYAAF